MIRLQEGRDTEVITGLCLYRADRDEWVGAVEVSVVRFRPLTIANATTYLDSGRWEGKSGGYGVQDRDPFVSVVSGSFSNVVGPAHGAARSAAGLYPIAELLRSSRNRRMHRTDVRWMCRSQESNPWDGVSSRTGPTRD